MINKIRERMNKIPLAIKASTAYAVSSIILRCFSFITLPLFTRLLTKEQYGQGTIYSSWSGILSIFITLNLAYGSFSTAMVKYEKRRDEYISAVQGIFVLLAGIFFLIYIPFRSFWNQVFELPSLFVIIMVLEVLFSNALLLWSGKKRFEFKYKSVVVITLLGAVLSTVLAYIFVISTDERGYARILGCAIVNILIGFIIFVLNLAKGKKIYDKEFWKYAWSFNLPLLAYYLSQVIFNTSDRIMISHMSGTGNAAMYGVAYNLATVFAFILNAINNSYVPWFYGKIKEGKGEENKIVSIVIAIIMAVMILFIIWFAPEIIIILAGRQYAPAIYVVAPVAMSLLLLFYSQLFINVEFYYEEKKTLVWASIGAAVLNIVLNYLLIPCLGFVAAGYTTLISYIVFAISNYLAMKAIILKRGMPDNMYDYKSLILLFVLFMVCGFVGVALYGWIIPRILITVTVLIVMFGYRKKLIEILRLIKNRDCF